MKEPMRRVVRRLGYELQRVGGSEDRLLGRLLAEEEIDLVVDVGANQGQYGSRLRFLGYGGKILSFEPLAEAYRLLQQISSEDSEWAVRNVALGASSAEGHLRVAANSVSSSLLDATTEHLIAESQARAIGREGVTVSTLASELMPRPDSSLWLKLDVQGMEKQVLEGAAGILHHVKVLHCEISLVPMYVGQTSYIELLEFIEAAGFVPIWVAPALLNLETGEMLQLDSLFARRYSPDDR